MFTTEHYRAIAEVIASHQTDPDHCERCADKRVTLSLLAYDFATMFERDNPRFKVHQFYVAAGFSPSGAIVKSEQEAVNRSMEDHR